MTSTPPAPVSGPGPGPGPGPGDTGITLPPQRFSLMRFLPVVLVLVVAAIPLLLGGRAGLSPTEGRAAALALAALGFWATGRMPEAVTAVCFFAVSMLIGIAPTTVIFNGFASQAFWLVFAGVVLSLAASESGLARRLAMMPLDFFARSYTRLLTSAVLFGAGIAFLVPSTMGRVTLFVPILLAVADRLGLEPGRKGRTGMLMAFILGTYYLPLNILPANVPNVVLAGAMDSLYGRVMGYGEYLLLHFPVLAIGKIPFLILILRHFFPDRIDGVAPGESDGPLSGRVKLMALIFLLTLVGWASDSVHHIAPAWIGLTAAGICLLPILKLTPPKVFAGRLNMGPLFYVAAVLGIAGLVSSTGLGAHLSRAVLSLLPVAPGHDFTNFLSLSGLGGILGLVTTMPGVPAVLTPLAQDLANSAGWPLDAALMTTVIGFSLPIVPYQVPPVLVGLTLAGIERSRAIRPMLCMVAVSVIVLIPLDFLWWRMLGMFG